MVGIGFRNRGSTISYWIDGVRFYADEYIPTDIDAEEIRIAVTGKEKLTTTWGKLKAR